MAVFLTIEEIASAVKLPRNDVTKIKGKGECHLEVILTCVHNMSQAVLLNQQDPATKRRVAFGVWAIFFAQFISLLFANARNIATPSMVAELNGITLYSWYLAMPALSGAAGTLFFGKLSDIYGRRTVILLSISIFALGLGISGMSKSMPFLIASQTFMSIGHFPIVPLCFSKIGDLFPPSQRAKWTGLLNIPSGMAALFGPVLGGIVAESIFGWRGLYWGTIPLILIGAGMVAFALPNKAKGVRPKMDVLGTLVMVVATTTLIIGFTWLGDATKLMAGAILLVISLVAWVAFVQIEKRAAAPILDPQVLFNRTFMTVSSSGFLSFFGMVAVVGYSPIFVQDVMRVSPTISGSMLTPYTTLSAFMGIPAGFLLGKTKKYRWMYNISYVVMTLALFGMWRLSAETPIWIYVLVTSVIAFGLGVSFTLNTLVAQFSVSRELLGVAVGAIFFFQMIGIAVAPAILGLAQNSVPDLESGLKLVFLLGALASVIGLLLILTIPQIEMDESDE